MSNQLLFVGIGGGLAVALGLALLFSAISTQSTAQMGRQGMMDGTVGPRMMTTQSTETPWQWNQRSIFNANGMSTVENVQITGVSVTGSNEVRVSLRYDGENSPAVTVAAMTNPAAMMRGPIGLGGIMMGQGGIGLMDGNFGTIGPGIMYAGYGYGPMWTNNTQWQQWHEQMAQWHNTLNSTQWAEIQAWHNQMMAQGGLRAGPAWWNGTSAWTEQFSAFHQQTGSRVLDAGWDQETSVTVYLQDDTSAYEANGIYVMVFPLTS